jgi:hypothetical protein
MPGSEYSTGSRGSRGPKYKTVQRNANVDESLFGAGGKKSGKNGKLKVETDAVVIDRGELWRLRQNATVTTVADEEAKRKAAAAQKEKAQEAARARKAHMLALEEQRKKNAPLTDIEEENVAKAESLLDRAKEKLDEGLDDVKHMNQMMLYAKCVTIRDAQLLEKQLIENEKISVDKKIDMEMEQERLKAIRIYEERDIKRHEDRIAGSVVLKKQIQERERERIIQQELMEQEREAMLRQMDILKVEEKRQAEARKEAGKKLLREASAANEEQIKRKQKQIEQEMEEDRRVAEYIKAKDLREQQQLEEAERIRQEKERETARLRALQEKASDKQAELDALRAKRATEAHEREWREKERCSALIGRSCMHVWGCVVGCESDEEESRSTFIGHACM